MIHGKLFKKSVFIILSCLVLVRFTVFSTLAAKYPNPKSNFFVNDFANVIESDDEDDMQNRGEQLFSDTTAQVVVVTLKNLSGMDMNTYSIGLARQWGIGSDDKNNGVLLILAEEEREVRIEVGSGLEGDLTDAKTGRILDLYGMEYFKNDDFSTGLKQVYSALINEVYIANDMEPVEDYTAVSEYEEEDEADWVEIVGLIILVIAISVLFKFRRRGGPGGGIPFFFFGGGPHNNNGNHGGGFSGGGGGFSGGGSGRKF